MKTMVLLLPNRKPAEVWKRGIKYAQQYDSDLVALLLCDKDNSLPRNQELLTGFLEQAKLAGINASGEVIVREEDFDLFAYKKKHDIRMLIM